LTVACSSAADINDGQIPDEIANKRKLDQEDDDEVDVVTIERVRGEFSEESFVIPVILEEDDETFDSSDSD
jgi:COMPASS component SWD1